jgi:hypothetical protein
MSTSIFQGMSDEELDLIEARIREATSGPWASFVEGRDHTSGSSFIRTPVNDIELSGASASDQDFIAHARDDIPKLLREVRRLRRRAAPR